MKPLVCLALIMIMTTGLTNAQKEASFSVVMNPDTILAGNFFEVTFTLKNGKGKNFVPPDFQDFYLKGGPSQASSFSMVNGEIDQQQSFSYFLEPKGEGNFYLGPASIEVDGATLETLPLEVLVLPNPDGIIQQPEKTERTPFQFHQQFEFPPKPSEKEMPQKKRKTYRL